MALLALANTGSFTASNDPSPYGSPPDLTSDAGRQEFASDHARKTWKAYHERQALIAVERQYGRPVQVDPMLWGDLLQGKLEQLIEGERNHPRNVVRGGAADRDGGRCLLPDLDDARLQTGHDRAVAAAVGKPRPLRFSEEGSEYTADSFGAGGGFSEMYERRYDGFNARAKEAGGLAAERAWSRAGRPSGTAGESHRERRSKEKKERDAQTIPWTLGTAQAVESGGSGGGGSEQAGGGGKGEVISSSFGDDLFAGDADSALSAAANGGDTRERPGTDLEAHPRAHIGPDTHTFKAEEVEVVNQAREEEKADGSNASLSAQMEHRLVPMGAGTGAARKLRGTAARERKEQARIVSTDLYLARAVSRNSHAATEVDRNDNNDDDDDDDDDDSSTLCSVITFEGHYTKTTQAADALPTVERMLSHDEQQGPGRTDRGGAALSDGRRPMEGVGATAAPTEETIERERRREERRADRKAKMDQKRGKRSATTATLDSASHTPPGEMLILRRPENDGIRSGRFRNTSDDVSLAPSMSSLGSFDECRGSAPGLFLEPSLAGETGASDSRLQQAVLMSLPPAVGHTPGDIVDKLPSVRRRSTRTHRHTTPPMPPKYQTVPSESGRVNVGSRSPVFSSAASRTGGDCSSAEFVLPAAVAPTGRERVSSRSSIAFRGTGKRRRSNGSSISGSSSSSGIGSGGGRGGSSLGSRGRASDTNTTRSHAAGQRPSATVSLVAADTSGGGDGISRSSRFSPGTASTTPTATAARLKGKIAGWRRTLTKPAVPLSRVVPSRSISSPATSIDDRSRAARSNTTGSKSARAAPAALGKAATGDKTRVHQQRQQVLPLMPPAGRGSTAMIDDERTLQGSVTSSLTTFSSSTRGGKPAAAAAESMAAAAVVIPPLSGTGVSVTANSALLSSSTLEEGTVSGGSTNTVTVRSRTTGRTAFTASVAMAGLPETGPMVPGGSDPFSAVRDEGEGVEAGGGGGGGGMMAGRKKPRGGGGGGGGGGEGGKAKRVHKINLGSKRDQKLMTPAERTALLIGACEWGDLEALEHLLELGASPLDPHSSSLGQSRCVFCQFFVFVLQVEAGLRPRLAPDDSLYDRALSLLIDAGLKDNPRFLLNPRLRDRDERRGFCLLHHAAAFGNVSKVEFLLRKGVEPDVRAKGGDETALMVAARRGQRLHLRVAAALVQAGSSMLARDREGMTALHHAADVGRKHMCHYLLLVGADKTSQDAQGRTPMDLCRTKHPRAFAALRSFIRCRPPPAAILDYMEKVEVQGLKHSAAQEKILLEQEAKKEQQQQLQQNGQRVAAGLVLGGGADGDSLASSWDAASLGGMSGAGAASVLSLGSLIPAAAAAATVRAGSR